MCRVLFRYYRCVIVGVAKTSVSSWPIGLVKYRFSQSHLGDSLSLPNKIRQIFVREVLGRASPLELAEHLL